MPPELLQQHGLQLLQAMAAPLQQLQLTASDNRWRTVLVDEAASNRSGSFSQQLLALKAAAPGLVLHELVLPTTGAKLTATPLFSLAAAHPQAFTALIDCCLRSPVMQAVDMLAAVEVLAHAAVAVLGSGARPSGALDDTAAVAGLASAVTSFAKRAEQLTRAAIKQQPQVAQGFGAAAAACFPAALLVMT